MIKLPVIREWIAPILMVVALFSWMVALGGKVSGELFWGWRGTVLISFMSQTIAIVLILLTIPTENDTPKNNSRGNSRKRYPR